MKAARGAMACAIVVACACKLKKDKPEPAPAPTPAVAIDGAQASDAAVVTAVIDGPAADAGLAVHEGGGDSVGLLADARRWVQASYSGVWLTRFQASYVRSDGLLDPTYGELKIDFGVPERPPVLEEIDDPNRPTGAPIARPKPEPVETSGGTLMTRDSRECPHLTWKASGWIVVPGPCRDPEGYFGPRCSPAAVWKRAIAAGAPENALAVLTLTAPGKTDRYPRWLFSITDKLRNVNFARTYADDCPVTVEDVR